MAGTKLKAGDYIVTIEGKQAVFKKGKDTFPVPVDVEKADKKFSTTSLELAGDAIKAIDLGGTDNILVFAPAQ